MIWTPLFGLHFMINKVNNNLYAQARKASWPFWSSASPLTSERSFIILCNIPIMYIVIPWYLVIFYPNPLPWININWRLCICWFWDTSHFTIIYHVIWDAFRVLFWLIQLPGCSCLNKLLFYPTTLLIFKVLKCFTNWKYRSWHVFNSPLTTPPQLIIFIFAPCWWPHVCTKY